MFVRVLLWTSVPERRFALILFNCVLIYNLHFYSSLGDAQWRVQGDEKGCPKDRSRLRSAAGLDHSKAKRMYFLNNIMFDY